jgi:hypothetical protein
MRPFIALQVAFSVVVLFVGGLLVLSFVRISGVNPGYSASNVLLLSVEPLSRVDPVERRAALFRVVDRLRAVPGVESVAATSSIPLAGTENLRQVTIESRERPEPGKEIVADYRMITDGYFKVMGIPHVAGEPLRIRKLRPQIGWS